MARFLRDRSVDGSLSVDTCCERVELVYDARSIAELESLCRDLPGRPSGRLGPWRRLVTSAGQTLRAAALGAGLADASADPVMPLLVDAAWSGRLGRGRFTIGRAYDCDRRLDDPSVSRHHAELRHEDGGWTVSDLQSLNGVYLNGRRVWRAALAAGDELILGAIRMSFEPRDSQRAPTSAQLTSEQSLSPG